MRTKHVNLVLGLLLSCLASRHAENFSAEDLARRTMERGNCLGYAGREL
jgi:hypothetical protein